jgi:hypothetical protein
VAVSQGRRPAGRPQRGSTALTAAPGPTTAAGLHAAEARSALDLHEGLSDADLAKRAAILAAGCTRWPKRLRLASAVGGLVPGRCRSTNVCAYCAILSSVEWSEMIALDALDGDAPTLYAVLTTREATLDTASYYDARRQVMRALARRWPDVRYLCVLEFTTGYAHTSGGRRRPHWNLLLKGIPVDDAKAARAIIRRVWCAQVDAKPGAQYVASVGNAGGVMRYLALHFLKESQAPPQGWRGQRVSFSVSRRSRSGVLLRRGYFSRDVWQVRQDAQSALRLKREVWKAERAGYNGAEALHVAELARLRAEQISWECVVLTVDDVTGEITRGRPLRGGGVTVAMRSDTTRARRRRINDDVARAMREVTELQRSAASSSAVDDAGDSAPQDRARDRSTQDPAQLRIEPTSLCAD